MVPVLNIEVSAAFLTAIRGVQMFTYRKFIPSNAHEYGLSFLFI
jgi:hypothetical protein